MTPRLKKAFCSCLLTDYCLAVCSFYAAYHGIKYFSRVVRDENDISNAVMAGFATVGPMLASATFRRNTAYAVMLIAMDVIGEQGDEAAKPQ